MWCQSCGVNTSAVVIVILHVIIRGLRGQSQYIALQINIGKKIPVLIQFADYPILRIIYALYNICQPLNCCYWIILKLLILYNKIAQLIKVISVFQVIDMPALAIFIFPFNSEFIQCLSFAQAFHLDVRDFHTFGYDILVVYNPLDVLMLQGWLHNPPRFHFDQLTL